MRWVLSDHSIFYSNLARAYPVRHGQRARTGHLHHAVGSRMAGVRRPSAAAGRLAARADPQPGRRDTSTQGIAERGLTAASPPTAARSSAGRTTLA